MPSCLNHIDVMEGLSKCARCGKTFCGDCVVELKGCFFCGACKSEQVKDIQSGVDATQLPLASVGSRFAAQFIDGIVMRVVTIPLNFIFTPRDRKSTRLNSSHLKLSRMPSSA